MKFKKGNSVEVLRREEDQCASWFPARITSVEGSMCTVKYELFLTSDGKSMVETVAEEDVRPCPPPLKQKKPWIAGDEAEALDICSWRIGKVLKVLKFDRLVIKLSGFIQLKEYSVSDLRVPQAWHDGQWNMIDKGSGKKQICCDYIQSNFSSARKLDCETSQGIGKHSSVECGSKRKHLGSSSIGNVKRNLNSNCGFTPVDLVRGTDHKMKSILDLADKLTRRPLPNEMDNLSFSKDTATEHFMNKSSRDIIDAKRRYINNHVRNSLPPSFPVTEDNTECSVASCSGKEHPVCANVKRRKLSKSNAFSSLDESMSSGPVKGAQDYQSKSGDELSANIHDLELHAYRSTIKALHASGPLTWEQESLLTNLRLFLNISNEEHLVHLKLLLSA